jgi:hypothetical protein
MAKRHLKENNQLKERAKQRRAMGVAFFNFELCFLFCKKAKYRDQ